MKFIKKYTSLIILFSSILFLPQCNIANTECDGIDAVNCNPVLNLPLLNFTPKFSISGFFTFVSGNTNADGLILKNNGMESLTVTGGNLTFQFQSLIPDGGAYNVQVETFPISPIYDLYCTACDNYGYVSGANVTNINVVCSQGSGTIVTVGGSISGYTTGSGLQIQLNGGPPQTIASGSDPLSYIFTQLIADKSNYNVQIYANPAGLTCTLSNNIGSVNGSDITDVNISCI